jgi:hypothetical protein
MKDFLCSNTTLRGIKFLKTDTDASSFLLLHDFFVGNSSLRVFDAFGNTKLGDEAIMEVLEAMTEGGVMLETLNVGERTFGEEVDEGVVRVSEVGVASMMDFVSRSECT